MDVSRIVGIGAGLGLVGLGYAGLAGQDNTVRDDTGAVVEGGELGALRIRVGDCILDDGEDGEIEVVDAVPCAEQHRSEVFAAFVLGGGDDAEYPGDDAVFLEAADGCYLRFEEFVGHPYESSVYNFGTITPTEDSWDHLDDREVLCTVFRFDGSLKSGTARGSNR